MSAEHTKSPEEIIQSWILEAEPKLLIQNKFVKQLVESSRDLLNTFPCEINITETKGVEKALKPWEVEE